MPDSRRLRADGGTDVDSAERGVGEESQRADGDSEAVRPDERGTEREAGGPSSTTAWHALGVESVFDSLDATESGLSSEAVERRLSEYGPNEISEGREISPVEIFVSQFQDFLIYLLFFAALLSLAVGVLPDVEPNYVDAGLITLILLANGVFGFVQDYRAEKSMEALRELSTPDATVRRNGERRSIPAGDVVPGDVLLLEQGDAVPADARVVSATNLETNESALTGESTSIQKQTEPLDEKTPLAERQNMVYMNTSVVKGRGEAVVVSTGMDTQVGAIATQIQEAEDQETPFQREVDELGRRIGYGIVGLIAVISVVQYFLTSASVLSIFLVGTTLAVAAVPEGLPAVVTLTLALGSRKMLDRNALVRRLPVVESLGSVDVIVTDKTGTLTESQMTVRRLSFGGETYEVSGAGLQTEGEFSRDGETVDPDVVEPLLRCGLRCNNAERAPEDEDEEFYGDPTEVAVLVSALKAGVEPGGDRVREVPFSSERKRMTVVVDDDDGPTAYTKGAPEVVLDRCDRVIEDGEVVDLTDERRREILDTNERFAGDALRVLGFATKSVSDPDADEEELESGLVFLGLQGMIDPPRDEVPEAVADCRDAGIRVVMATGDNLATAKAIGEQIGFDPEGAMTGAEVGDLSDDELLDVVEDVDIFARVSPEHKVRILKALQENGHDVAMTGDGVNDAPALRNADVGVSMGQRGTDVAQQASDMVLRDDNFATIRDAIAAGRSIFDNIRKFVNLLLSANTGEVLVVFLGVLVGSVLFPESFAAESEALILTPVMLLWINLVTDGFPALALGADPKAPDVMDREPRTDGDSVIDAQMIVSILTIGTVMTLAGLTLFFYGLEETGDILTAQTLLFTFIVVGEMGVIQIIRSRFNQSPLSNRWLLGAVALSLGLQVLLLYTPLNALFDVVALSAIQWEWVGVAFAVFFVLNYAGAKLSRRHFG
jgi:Ca2+-transporting ATPase